MKKYLGVKIITATPMTHGEFANEKYGEDQIETKFSKENVNSEGYKVVYEDGYTSWSPKEVFEKAYREVGGLSFGLAIEAMKKGLRVARTGWNGKGMFIFMRPADELHIDTVVNKIKSLPQSVKDYYYKDTIDENGNPLALAEDDVVLFTAYLCLKAADGTIVNGWSATQTDILAEDWQIVGE